MAWAGLSRPGVNANEPDQFAYFPCCGGGIGNKELKHRVHDLYANYHQVYRSVH